MNNTKFNPVHLASSAYYLAMCLDDDIETTFAHGDAKMWLGNNSIDINTKHLLVTRYKDAIPNANEHLKDYFASSQYQNATHKKFHIIDLDQYDYDSASIKLSRTHKFKPVSSLSKCQKLTRIISRRTASSNGIEIDPILRMAFEEMLEPDDFFKFQEVRTEFRVSISLVKNGKVFKKIKMNIGYFTLVFGSKPYDYQEEESKQKKATRPSLSNPVYKDDGIEFMVTFNDRNKDYRTMVEMMKI